MFIVSKALFISSATVIVRAGEAIRSHPFATVLFNVCSGDTVECCVLYPCGVGGFGSLLLCKEAGSSVFAITERMYMGLYEMPLSMSLLGFGVGTMLDNIHVCGIIVVLRVFFNMLVRNASPIWPMCFRCLICQYLVSCYFILFCFIASWT